MRLRRTGALDVRLEGDCWVWVLVGPGFVGRGSAWSPGAACLDAWRWLRALRGILESS